jgi:uncharacterized protein (DUF433 family)
MRISVEVIPSLLALDETQEAIIDDYPGLQPEEIGACPAHAHAVQADGSARRRRCGPRLNLSRPFHNS